MGQDGPRQSSVLGRAILACSAAGRLDGRTLFSERERFNSPDTNAVTIEIGRDASRNC